MFSDSCCDTDLNVARGPQPAAPPQDGPRIAADLQILATVQQVLLQQQLVGTQVGELHKSFHMQVSALRHTQEQVSEVRMQLQLALATLQLQVQLAHQSLNAQQQTAPCSPTAAAAAAAADEPAQEETGAADNGQPRTSSKDEEDGQQQPGDPALEDQRAKVEELQAQLRRRQRPGSRMRRRLRCAETVSSDAGSLAPDTRRGGGGASSAASQHSGREEDNIEEEEDGAKSDAAASAAGSVHSTASGGRKKRWAEKIEAKRLLLAAAEASVASTTAGSVQSLSDGRQDRLAQRCATPKRERGSRQGSHKQERAESPKDEKGEKNPQDWHPAALPKDALLEAARKEQWHRVAAILSRKDFTGINAKDKDGYTALHWAADFGHARSCRAILEHADFTEVNAKTEDGWTALHIAAVEGHTEACREILRHTNFNDVPQKEGSWSTLDWLLGV
eukprot:gnl/TRDRNA2_/TRDRNA2_82898_c0_seq1.p1 gnl/TRDRNA2_/TRDRNA2_82898_c0~~gnl/TRDRNA2_/TRDRNA2_82898_c0_seq1.p1  ORF type:complete len:448 (+),score=99.65 gnl/TRDRNA2_/TRDRNA2_82898_c0_seq1:130-1473(+)